MNDDGSIIAIGAILNDGNGSNSGHVRIYKYINEAWEQIGDDIDGKSSSDEFGYSVSLNNDGSIVAIGAINDAGYVSIFKNENNTWSQIGQDIIGEEIGDWSGIALSLSSEGSIVAIGARDNDGNGTKSGQVRIYQNEGGDLEPSRAGY